MATKILFMNKGDSFELPFILTDATNKPQLLQSHDVVYFAIMSPNQAFEDAILIKGYTAEDQNLDNAEIIIKLLPNDTRPLQPGVYYYTIKYQRGGTLDVINDLDDADEVRTLVDRTKFIIYN